ncbi:MAG: prolipoprotein diacylglyceryl transferase [Oscillospiraceae bacterium]|nr:prolipoprotein diacylglyceryl transferase [Oscillospiraceae bacterium]
MRFLTDYTLVEFPGLGWKFDIYANLVEFTIPGWDIDVTIRFYGVIIAFGFILAVLFGGRMAYKWKMDLNKMLDVLLYGTVAGIVGARLYYVIFEWNSYKNDLLSIFRIWEGGLAIYGGIIGGILAAYFVCKHNGLPFLKLLDLFGMSVLIGQGIGRWGNFTNQEAFGTNTNLPWGMWSEKIANYINVNYATLAAGGIDMDASKPVHPTFLYESVWCLLGFLILYIVCKRFRKFDGQLILGYGVIYGLERAVVEGLRTDSLYIANTNIRVSQVLSLLIAVLCLTITIVKFVQIHRRNVYKVNEYKEKKNADN